MLTDGSPVGAAEVPLGGRYTPRSVVGRGGMAAVYRARDETLGRDVAIKLFPPQGADAEEMRRQQAELRLAATLNHPALVTLFDAGTDLRTPDEPRMFLVMEFVEGQDLRKRLLQGRLPAADVVRIGADIASALDYIHSFGVLHRDIKPANILLAEASPGVRPASDPSPAGATADEPGADGWSGTGEVGALRTGLHAKLTDFGIARITEGTRLTATGSTVGTAAYLSPEQAKGMPLGPASDIYSLGLVLLECLTGRTEYPGGAVEAAVARLMRQPQMPDGLDEGWAALLEAMTAAEPSERPTAQAVAALLADDGASEPTREAPRTLDMGQTQLLPLLPDATSTSSGLAGLFTGDEPLLRRGSHGPHALETREPLSTGSGVADQDVTAQHDEPGVNRRWHRAAWISAAVLALVSLSIAVSAMLSAPAPTTVPTAPAYPTISGQLGQHLQQLQRSVEP